MTEAANGNAELPARISLVVSDVDGTLVDPTKALRPETIAAAHRLRDAGIALGIVSSRPPRGVKPLADQLGLDVFGGFNGGSLVHSDLTPIEAHVLPLAAAQTTVRVLAENGAEIWVFADGEWIITDPDGEYVPLERHTVQFEPTIVAAFGDELARVGKIVAASSDHAMLDRVEVELRALLGDQASVVRSQEYYVDISHPTADKGHAVRGFAHYFGVPLSEIAVIGDMPNDLPMFDVGALKIAMGNSRPEVKARADLVTGSNDGDGWAQAMDRFVIPRAPKG